MCNTWKARLLAGLFFFATVFPIYAAARSDRSYIGLLQIPMLRSEACADPDAPLIDVFAAPTAKSERLGRIETVASDSCRTIGLRTPSGELRDVPLGEFTYEPRSGLIALGRTKGWWRIRLGTGSGWIRATSVRESWSYTELVIDNDLATAAPEWDRRLYTAPGGKSELWPHDRPSLRVIDVRRVGKHLWFRVDILSGSPCGGSAVKPVAHGWIPAYSPDGDPLVRVPSRGC